MIRSFFFSSLCSTFIRSTMLFRLFFYFFFFCYMKCCYCWHLTYLIKKKKPFTLNSVTNCIFSSSQLIYILFSIIRSVHNHTDNFLLFIEFLLNRLIFNGIFQFQPNKNYMWTKKNWLTAFKANYFSNHFARAATGKIKRHRPTHIMDTYLVNQIRKQVK